MGPYASSSFFNASVWSSSLFNATAAAAPTGSSVGFCFPSGRSLFIFISCCAFLAPRRKAHSRSYCSCDDSFLILICTLASSVVTLSCSCHASAEHSKESDFPVPVGDSMRAFCFFVSAVRIFDIVIFCGTCGVKPSGKCTNTPCIGAPEPGGRTGGTGSGNTFDRDRFQRGFTHSSYRKSCVAPRPRRVCLLLCPPPMAGPSSSPPPCDPPNFTPPSVVSTAFGSRVGCQADRASGDAFVEVVSSTHRVSGGDAS